MKRTTAGFDSPESLARELVMWVNNDATIYERTLMPIWKNMTRKMAAGTFDPDLAVKGFMYAADSGAKSYSREFGGVWHKNFPKDVRRMAASMLLEEFMAEMDVAPESFEEYVPKKYKKDWPRKPRSARARATTTTKRGEIMTRRNNRRNLRDRVERARSRSASKRRVSSRRRREDSRIERLERRVANLRKMLRQAELEERVEERPSLAARKREARVREIREKIAAERRRMAKTDRRRRTPRRDPERKASAQRPETRLKRRSAKRAAPPKREAATKREAAPKYFKRKKDGKVYVRVD